MLQSNLLVVAACWSAGGWPVIVRDPSEASRQQALEYVKENIETYTTITQRTAASVNATEDFATAVKDAWLVIEAVPENLQIKESTFADLEKHAPKDCILASNSSSYKSGELVSKISEETKTRVLNTH